MASATFVIDWTARNDSYSITLEGHDRKLGVGICYTVRMFTSDGHKSFVQVKCSPGTLIEISGQSVLLKETISFSNDNSAGGRVFMESLAAPIDVSLGFFVDENYDFVTPTITLENGKLKSSIKITGSVVVEYYANARLFNHFPGRETFNKTRWGTILAFNKSKKATASFDTFSGFTDKNRRDAIIVYRNLVINSHENSPFEKPSNWPDENDYTGLTPLTSEKPELGIGAEQQKIMQVVYTSNATHQYDTPANDWFTPSHGALWSNAVIHVKRNYPATPDDDFDSQIIAALDSEYNYLVDYYSARFVTVIQE